MYTREQLEQYPYFKNILAGRRISDVLDPLTGLVQRQHMIGFVKELTGQEQPFTFGMIDLDNFKYINDTYGHSAGDTVLQGVAEKLAGYIGDRGIAGRFGGDELLFINFSDVTYFAKKQFCLGMFADAKVLRRTYMAGNYELFVTATAGLATYPHDASDYDSMFETIDKTLYRGKSKGRNCYIIYVESKHKDIVIRELKVHSQYEIMHAITERFDAVFDVQEKLKAFFNCAGDDLHISDVYYAGPSGLFRSANTGQELGNCADIGAIMYDDVVTTNNIDAFCADAPLSRSILKHNGFETFLIAKVKMGKQLMGYLMLAEPHSLRIWQDNEVVLLFAVSRMLAGFLAGTRTSLE